MEKKLPMSKDDKPLNTKAHAIRVNCTDDLAVSVEFLNEDFEPFANIVLGPEMADMMLARLFYVRDQTLGLIPNTTIQ